MSSVSIEDVTAEGDMVYVLHTHTAKHTGPFMGMPPTGKDIVVNGVELFRMREGRIVEFWRKDDDAVCSCSLACCRHPKLHKT